MPFTAVNHYPHSSPADENWQWCEDTNDSSSWTGTSSNCEATGNMWESPLCHHFVANQLGRGDGQREGSITPAHISLVSLTSFPGVGEAVLNPPEAVRKPPPRKEKWERKYIGGLLKSFGLFTLPWSNRVDHGPFLAIFRLQIWGLLPVTRSHWIAKWHAGVNNPKTHTTLVAHHQIR